MADKAQSLLEDIYSLFPVLCSAHNTQKNVETRLNPMRESEALGSLFS
jgi:hypothetical protein